MKIPENFALLMRLQEYQRDPTRVATARDHYRQNMAGPLPPPYTRVIPWGTDRREDFVVKTLTLGRHPEAIPKALESARGEGITGVVVHNRWVAVCDCGQTEVVDPKDPRFYCYVCRNILNDGYPRPVLFPNPPEDVECLLLVRPDVTTRGYVPVELAGVSQVTLQGYVPDDTLESLAAENAAHGLPKVGRRVG